MTMNELSKAVAAEILKAQITITQGIDPKPVRTATVKDILDEIEDGTHAELIQKIRKLKAAGDEESVKKLKKELPAAIFQGLFTRQHTDHLKTPSGIIIADIDHHPAPEQLKALLEDDEHVLFAFISPSGDGLKVGLIGFGIDGPDAHSRLFAAVSNYFGEVYRIGIDPACKNISRLTFLSWDSELYIAEKCAFFPVADWQQEPAKNTIETVNPDDVVKNDSTLKYAQDRLEFCCKQLAASQPTKQHTARIKYSNLAGGLLHYGIDASAALEALVNACKQAGMKNLNACKKHLQQGLKFGASRPLKAPDNIIYGSALKPDGLTGSEFLKESRRLLRAYKDAQYAVYEQGSPLLDRITKENRDDIRKQIKELIKIQDAAGKALMNFRHFFCFQGGKALVYTREKSTIPSLDTVDLVPSTHQQVSQIYANLRGWKLSSKDSLYQKESLFCEWNQNPKRPEKRAVLFRPGVNMGSDVHNLWQGFGVKPVKGDWELLRHHYRDIICSGDETQFNYLMMWLADLVQNMDSKTGIAVLLHSEPQGTGKGLAVEPLLRIFGRHSLRLESVNQLIGRFNSHLADKMIVFADESLWGGDKAAMGKVKGMITERTRAVERKGVDVQQLDDCTRYIFASNAEHAVPIEVHDRRWFCPSVSAHKKGDWNYFKALADQVNGPAIGAMLYDLLEAPKPTRAELQQIPSSETKTEQTLRTMSLEDRFLYNFLDGDVDTLSGDGVQESWTDVLDCSIEKDSFYELYQAYCDEMHKNQFRADRRILFKHIKQRLVDTVKEARPRDLSGRQRVLKFAPRMICKQAFEMTTGLRIWGVYIAE